MKTKKNNIKSLFVECLLILPLLIFIGCDNTNDEIVNDNEAYLTKNSKVTELIQLTATNNTIYKSNSGIKKSSNTSTVYCTGFKYPISFDYFYGDNPEPKQIIINSDEELLEFFNVTLTEDHRYYVFFPLTLLDAEGVETTVNSVEELEGSLQMALEICGDVEDSSDDNDDSNDSDNDGDSTNDNDSDNDNNSDQDNYEYCDSKMKKVSICHKGINICVSVNAIWGHLNQHDEDFLGTCK